MFRLALFCGLSLFWSAVGSDSGLPKAGGGAEVEFIWLMQGKEALDLSFLRSPRSHAIQVVWGSEPEAEYREDAFWLPSSTCTEGRNYLIQQALQRERARGIRYTFFIFTEDDAELEEIIDFGLNTGDPYRTFEKYLSEWRPAVAFPFNGHGMPDPEDEVVAACWWDHLMVSIHREALPVLLPYWTGLDHESWWFPQRIVTVLSSAFYHQHRIQINAVAAMNTQHRWNPELTSADFGRAEGFLIPAITRYADLETAACAFDQDRAVPKGLPKKKTSTNYTLQGYFEECHPLRRAMRQFWRAMPSGDRKHTKTHLNLGEEEPECTMYSLTEAAAERAYNLTTSSIHGKSGHMRSCKKDFEGDDLEGLKACAMDVMKSVADKRKEQISVLSPAHGDVFEHGKSAHFLIRAAGITHEYTLTISQEEFVSSRSSFLLHSWSLDESDPGLYAIEVSSMERKDCGQRWGQRSGEDGSEQGTCADAWRELSAYITPSDITSIPSQGRYGEAGVKMLKLELFRPDGSKAAASHLSLRVMESNTEL